RLPSWMAASPTPEAPACTSSVSPRARPPSTTRVRNAVRKASGIPAAATRSRPAGAGNTCPTGAATYSAWPPPATSAHTASPVSSVVPDSSSPMLSGSPGGDGYRPAICSRSARFTPEAAAHQDLSLAGHRPLGLREGRDVATLELGDLEESHGANTSRRALVRAKFGRHEATLLDRRRRRAVDARLPRRGVGCPAARRSGAVRQARARRLPGRPL